MNSYPQKTVVARPKNVTQGGCKFSRLLGVMLLLLCAVGLTLNAAAQFAANNDGKDVAITAESCLPANGFIDPGETNTLSFVIKNTSGGDRTDVKVNILPVQGVTFQSGEVNVGNVAKDATFTVSFSFRADGSCGGTLTPRLRVTSNADPVEFNYIGFQLGATVKTPYNGSSTTAIAINDFTTPDAGRGRATPYPSTIAIAGVPKAETGERIDNVVVTLHNVTHSWSPDIQAMLVGPNGNKVILMANAGGASDITAAINNVTLTFDEEASAQLPPASQIVSGNFKTSNFGGGNFPDQGNATHTSLKDAFSNMADPNGNWRLFIYDDSSLNSGTIAGGWSLTLRTTKIVCCGAGQLWPFVDRIGEHVMDEDGASDSNRRTIATFNVRDLDDADSTKLTVTAVSGDQSKVTNDNFVIENAGGTLRTLKVKSLVANAFGNAPITVVVTDPQGHTSTSTFNLKINSINDRPSVSNILGQKVTKGTSTGPIAFTVSDVETLAENLLVLPSTSNPNVVPVENIIIGGSGGNRTVNVLPANSEIGSNPNTDFATITLVIRAPGENNVTEGTTREFLVDFRAQTGNPTITPLSPVSVNEDGSITIPFNVRSGVASISPDALTLTRTSADATLLPVNNIVFGGSGIDRTATLTPAANRNGQVSVTFTVANGALTDSTTFTLTVNPVNDAPTITGVGPVTTNEDTTTGDIVFTVADNETAVSALNVTVTSDNTALVPNTNVADPASLTGAGGSSIVVNGAARTIRVRPVANQFGKATLTVTVADTGDPAGTPASDPVENKRPKAASTSFVLTVNAVNDAPTITSVANPGETAVPFPAEGDPTITFNEDSDNTTGDDIVRRRTITLGGIIPGNANESSQTTTVTATSSDSSIVSIEKVDPASVTGATANTTLFVRLGENRFGEVTITLVLTDNGGTDLGGVATTTETFKINVAAVNDAPALSFPTLLPPLAEGQPPRLNAPKNRSFTLPMTLNDVETPRTFVAMAATVTGDTQGIFPAGSILFDPGRTLVTFIPNGTPTTLPYPVTVTVTATDRGPTNGDTGQATTTVAFTVTIQDIEPPTITSSSTEVQIDEDGVASVTLNIADNDPITTTTPAFSVRSDNPAVIPNDGILLGPLTIGTPATTATRQLAIVPATDQNGVANVTITVEDQETIQSAVTIRVTVRPVSDRPTIALRGIIQPTVDTVGAPQFKTITILEDKATKDESTDSDLLEFDVFDGANETPADNLVISKSSSNTDLVPVNNIVFSASGTRRTLTVTPAANRPTSATASSLITLTVTDESGLSASSSFTLTVTAVNDAPTINQVGNLTLNENAAEQTVNLSNVRIGPDSDQVIDLIEVTEKDKGSANPETHNVLEITAQPNLATLSDGNISFRFRPRPFANGVGTITVKVRDDGGTANEGKNETTMSFDVTVVGVNNAPVITFQQTGAVDTETDVTIQQGGNSGVLTFYVRDPGETPFENLQVTAISSNPNLIPNTAANLQLGGGFETRGLLIQPVAGQGGTAVVTLTVTDSGGATATARINVTVIPGVNPAITLTPSSQRIGVGQFTDLIQINLFDAQTPADQLKIGYQDAGLLSSDNPTLVPASPSNIQFGGAGANRVMIILPNQNQTGTANITVRVKDADGNLGSAVFTLQVLGAAPTITTPVPASVSVDAGRTSPPVSVTVNDQETFAPLLTVTGKSSDQAIVADNNIFALGGATRSVTVLAGSKGGAATITLTVTDSEGQTATTTFVVNVNDQNPAPTITSIPAQTTTVNKATGLINFLVGDVGTAVADLTVTATSANTTLVPNSSANISLLTSPSNPAARSLVITPASNQSGVAIITVTVRDGGGKETSTSFALTVNRFVVPNDFNGDGSQDIIFQDGNGNLAAWFMSGDDLKAASFLTPGNIGDAGWRLVGTGDFNADTKTDLLYQYTDGTLAVWLMDGVTRTGGGFLSPSNPGSANWKVAATGDFNKDGKVDILYQHTNGTLAIWYMDGTTLASVATLRPSNAGAGWSVVGTGDVNGDGNLDVIFQHTNSTLAVWYLVGNSNLLLAGLVNPQMPSNGDWRAVGTIDLNGDGMSDLLFQNQADNSVAIWYMNKEKAILGKLLNPANPGATWDLVAP